MIVIAGGLLGATLGAVTAKKQGGAGLDMAQYAAAYAIAGALLGLILSIVIERLAI